MKKRILCLVLVLAILLPVQVFAKGEGDEGSSQKVILKTASDTYITDIGSVTKHVSYEAYYSSLSEIPESMIYYKYENGTQYAGMIPLVQIDIYPNNIPSFRYKATYQGIITEQI